MNKITKRKVKSLGALVLGLSVGAVAMNIDYNSFKGRANASLQPECGNINQYITDRTLGNVIRSIVLPIGYAGGESLKDLAHITDFQAVCIMHTRSRKKEFYEQEYRRKTNGDEKDFDKIMM